MTTEPTILDTDAIIDESLSDFEKLVDETLAGQPKYVAQAYLILADLAQEQGEDISGIVAPADLTAEVAGEIIYLLNEFVASREQTSMLDALEFLQESGDFDDELSAYLFVSAIQQTSEIGNLFQLLELIDDYDARAL